MVNVCFVFHTGSHWVDLADRELTIQTRIALNWFCLCLPSTEITCVQHHTQIKCNQSRTEMHWLIVLEPRKSNVQVPTPG